MNNKGIFSRQIHPPHVQCPAAPTTSRYMTAALETPTILLEQYQLSNHGEIYLPPRHYLFYRLLCVGSVELFE
jgi:hypothetical protein